MLFHVQTEDGGEKNPCITTHVFYHGNVITSRKSNYRHLMIEKDFEERIVKMMQDQHKATIKSLVKGDFDELENLKSILPKEEPKKEAPAKSSVYQIYNPEKDDEKLDIEGNESEKSLDEMILEYLSDKNED